MSGKFLKAIFAIVFSAGFIGQAQAAVISVSDPNEPYFVVGQNYADFSGDLWEYVGFFDLRDQSGDHRALTGLEAALALFPHAGDTVEDFALSAFVSDFLVAGAITDGEILNEMAANTTNYADVNHLSWYDTFDAAQALSILLESTIADLDGDSIYENGEISAYVSDRAVENINLNYVFIRATDVPEPSTIVILALAIGGFAVRRLKR